MHHEYHRWHSPALGRDMALDVVGHHGARVLVFPTSMGTHREWLDRRMHEVLADHIDQGWIQLFLLDHLPGETWNAEHLHPGARAWRHLQYDHYLVSEVLPFTASRNANPYVIATGASLGAYYAACLGLPASAPGEPDPRDERDLRHQAAHRRLLGPQRLRLQSPGLPPARARLRHGWRRSAARTSSSPSAATTRLTPTTRTCPPSSGARGSATPCASGTAGRTIGRTGSR